MGTPIQKEFGPGYDSPNRKFHFWAVILPTVLVTALAVVLVRHTLSPSSKVTQRSYSRLPHANLSAARVRGFDQGGDEDVELGGRT